MSDHPEERPSSRRRTHTISEALAFRPIGSGPATEPSAASRAGTLVLGSGIPAFDEGSIYIPTGADNELSYTTVQAWWEATVAQQKDPKVILYGIERVLRQILSCSDILAYGLCAILDKGFETQTFQQALGIQDEERMWNYLRDQSDIWRQALEKRETFRASTGAKIRAVKNILEALPDHPDVDKQGQPIKISATIVVLLGDPDSPWNVTHLARETIQTFAKVVETAVKMAGDRPFGTSPWVRFINRTLINRFEQPRTRGHNLRKFRPIRQDVQRLLEHIERHGPWFDVQQHLKVRQAEIDAWNEANVRASALCAMAMHPRFHVLCAQEDVDAYMQFRQAPRSPLHVRVGSLTTLEGSAGMPSIESMISRASLEATESTQRAESSIHVAEGGSPNTGQFAVGTAPSVTIPVLPRPPYLPALVGNITGHPSIQDENDPETFEVVNDPEGDEDLADDVSVHELDAAEDEDYDNTQHVRNARRVIAARSKKNKTCGCDTDKVEARILNQIKRDKKLTGAQLMTLMRDVYRATRQSRAVGQLPMCKSHLIILASKIGLKTAGLGIEDLWYRIMTICQRPNDIGDHKLALATTLWFTSASKALAPSDYLGIYRFPTQERKRMAKWNTQYRLKVAEHFLKKGGLKEWHDDGTINIDCFGWLWKPVPGLEELRDDGARRKFSPDKHRYLYPTTLADLFKLEFDCYLWHQRRVNDKPNLGWLRNCWYSLAQDVVRQDPFYYLLYILLREDNAYKLISYPYYCKYTQKDDKTSFRHIDLNIPKLLAEGRGKFQIQGSLSLDDESETDCTIVVKGFHKDEVIGTWYNRWQDEISDGYVHNMRHVYQKRDEQEFGEFEPVPCKAGQVRITQPHLPHGALGPAQGARRTILPWYVRVQEDNSTLEIVESGTWEELSIAHTCKSLPPATPSGYGVMYGKPPYRFPGSTTFLSRSPLSQALVGRRRWNDYGVLNQLERMVGASNEVEQVRQQFQNEVREQIPKLWQEFMEQEMREFGKYSFFYCQRRSLPQPEPWEGDEERIRHIIQQDKQVIEYVKKLETRRKGNYLAKAVEQPESEGSDIDDE